MPWHDLGLAPVHASYHLSDVTFCSLNLCISIRLGAAKADNGGDAAILQPGDIATPAAPSSTTVIRTAQEQAAAVSAAVALGVAAARAEAAATASIVAQTNTANLIAAVAQERFSQRVAVIEQQAAATADTEEYATVATRVRLLTPFNLARCTLGPVLRKVGTHAALHTCDMGPALAGSRHAVLVVQLGSSACTAAFVRSALSMAQAGGGGGGGGAPGVLAVCGVAFGQGPAQGVVHGFLLVQRPDCFLTGQIHDIFTQVSEPVAGGNEEGTVVKNNQRCAACHMSRCMRFGDSSQLPCHTQKNRFPRRRIANPGLLAFRADFKDWEKVGSLAGGIANRRVLEGKRRQSREDRQKICQETVNINHKFGTTL